MTSTFEPQGDNQIADLLKLAGRRPSPGAERMQQARDAARLEWRRSLAVRGRRRMVMTGAAAASVALLAASGWLWTMRSPKIVERPEIATVQVAVGAVRITDADGRPVAAVDGAMRRLRAGDRVEVADRGRAAFQLGEGTSIRLAGGTAVVFVSIGRLQLAQGGVYVDADPVRRAGSVTVETPFATVSHVGTQFELRSDPGSLDVRVREGEVSVDLPAGRLTTHAGEALLIDREHRVERRTIATSGPDWAWVTTMAQPFVLEGATVPAFLAWASREQGWRWEYADGAARRIAERAVLHGTIDGLSPEEAVRAVLPALGLASRWGGDRLVVSASGM